ncbi:MAG: DNA topoisomerase I [Planctomycetales bacterium]
MGGLIRLLMPLSVLRPVLRPLVRLMVGLIAIPLFRLFLRRVVRLQELDKELEKDLEQWFRGSLLLLIATANMEQFLFGWVPIDLQDEYAWLAVGLRLLLAIGVIEAMPDQELFSVIHPGPPKLRFPRGFLADLSEQWRAVGKGILCKHLNRSSPVFAIMAAIFGGPNDEHWTVGWVCYGLAISQYLLIGLVTSKDKALDALSEFDRQVAIRRRELIQEFDIDDRAAFAPASGGRRPPGGNVPDGGALPDRGLLADGAIPAITHRAAENAENAAP